MMPQHELFTTLATFILRMPLRQDIEDMQHNLFGALGCMRHCLRIFLICPIAFLSGVFGHSSPR